MGIKFIVDHNVGRLAKWLRIMGYDTRFFSGGDDASLVAIALAEGRVILTGDTHIMRRRVISSGRLKAILIRGDDPQEQMRQVIGTLKLDCHFKPFSRCLECNQPLVERDNQEVEDLVPPYVFQIQNQYMGCPACHRIYWRGTHWQEMTRRLKRLGEG